MVFSVDMSGALYDRKIEQADLFAAVERRLLSTETSANEFILISGKSGTGKTALANTLIEPIRAQNGMFISGKYDQLQQLKPYTAIVSAISDFVKQVIAGHDKIMKTIEDKILESLQSDIRILLALIPSLEQIVGSQGEAPTLRGTEVTKKLQLAIRNFMRTISAPENPLLFFLDDLQWADLGSLNLLKALASDKECRGLILVGACRYEEVELEDDFAAFLRDLEDSKLAVVKPIELHNLTRKAVNQLVSDKLQSPGNEVRGLSNSIYRKTKGNVFFVIKSLESLLENKILCKDDHGKWQWDDDDIRVWEKERHNVLEMVIDKIRRLSNDVQKVLSVAASLGAEFDEYILTVAIPDSNIPIAIDQSLENKLLEHKTDGYFRFTHDKIQQAALALAPEDQQKKFNLLIGRNLINNLVEAEVDKHIFLIVNQMCKGGKLITDQNEKDSLASLCLRAGQKSMCCSDFRTAVDFFSMGINLLSSDKWRDQYYLSLDLLNAFAEAKYCIADFDGMDKYINEILLNARSTRGKIRAYSTKLSALAGRQRYQEAIDLGFEVLRHLGEKFSSKTSKVAVIGEILKTNLILRGKSDDELLNIPDMCEPDKVDAMSILNFIASYSFRARRHIFPFVACRMIRLTLRHGQCAVSAYGFQVFAMLFCAIGRQSACCRYAHLGLKVLERYQIQEWTPRVFTVAYGMNLFITQPIGTLSDPLLCAHQVGLGTGDFEFAMAAANIHSNLIFFLGEPLLKVEKIISRYLSLMTEYKQDQFFNLTTPVLQVVHNLAGCSNDPIVLTGKVMNQAAALRIISESKDQSLEIGVSFWRMYLAYMFHDYELALEMAIASRPARVIIVLHQCLFDGLTTVAIGRTSKGREKRKYLKSAERSLKKAKKVTQSQHTAMNKLILLEAEITLQKSGIESALPLYERSIELAKNEGFVHEEALANERAGLALLHLNGEDLFGFSCLQRAINLYNSWGAHAKVAHLEKLFPKLVS